MSIGKLISKLIVELMARQIARQIASNRHVDSHKGHSCLMCKCLDMSPQQRLELTIQRLRGATSAGSDGYTSESIGGLTAAIIGGLTTMIKYLRVIGHLVYR